MRAQNSSSTAPLHRRVAVGPGVGTGVGSDVVGDSDGTHASHVAGHSKSNCGTPQDSLCKAQKASSGWSLHLAAGSAGWVLGAGVGSAVGPGVVGAELGPGVGDADVTGTGVDEGLGAGVGDDEGLGAGVGGGDGSEVVGDNDGNGGGHKPHVAGQSAPKPSSPHEPA